MRRPCAKTNLIDVEVVELRQDNNPEYTAIHNWKSAPGMVRVYLVSACTTINPNQVRIETHHFAPVHKICYLRLNK